jgi:glycosyltransferase involved in cell wall biosynthesis
MEFGVSNILLSICIPTWNRSKTLEKALLLLFPLVNKYSNIVEVIVSDNASNDSTMEVIDNAILAFPQVALIKNRNQKNLGFYGNFKVCRELSNGKYLWLLSDDDHIISRNILSIIIDQLINNDLDSVFLDNIASKRDIDLEKISSRKLLYKKTVMLTLISSVIFKNLKCKDKLIHQRFYLNSFIGFFYFVSSLDLNKGNSIIVRGAVFDQGREKPSNYDFYKVFIDEQSEALDYLLEMGMDTRFKNRYENEILRHHVKGRYIIIKW